jgi:hypothetical protein
MKKSAAGYLGDLSVMSHVECTTMSLCLANCADGEYATFVQNSLVGNCLEHDIVIILLLKEPCR